MPLVFTELGHYLLVLKVIYGISDEAASRISDLSREVSVRA